MKFKRYPNAFCFNSKNFQGSQIPCPVLMELPGKEPFIRVFFSARDKENRSNIFYADFTTEMKTIKGTVEPVLDLGPPGTFNADGQIASQLVIKDNTEFLLFVGVSEGNSKARYRYEHGIASRPLGSDEKFTHLGNILTRSERYPIGVSMPFYVEFNFDPETEPNPNFLTPSQAQRNKELLFFINFTSWAEVEGQGGVKKWEPTYKIECIELDPHLTFIEKLKTANLLKSTRISLPFNTLNDGRYEQLESLGRPWVYKEGDHLRILYCERSYHLYRGESFQHGYQIRTSESSNLNLSWWNYDTEYLTENGLDRHVGDLMQAYPALIKVPGGDTFLLFNNDFCSPIQAAKLIR